MVWRDSCSFKLLEEVQSAGSFFGYDGNMVSPRETWVDVQTKQCSNVKEVTLSMVPVGVLSNGRFVRARGLSTCYWSQVFLYGSWRVWFRNWYNLRWFPDRREVDLSEWCTKHGCQWLAYYRSEVSRKNQFGTPPGPGDLSSQLITGSAVATALC